MAELRKRMPAEICGSAVVSVEDYLVSKKTDLATGEVQPLTLAKSDTLLAWLADGSKLMIRPSGTEPKIKLYCGVVDKKSAITEASLKVAQTKVKALLDAAEAILTS
jgi:phosphoglucomutase/phosphomannomutase